MKTFREFNEAKDKWTGPSKDGTYTHPSGAKVVISGPQGRHYAYRANKKIVKSAGGRLVSFTSLEKAQKKALEK